LRELSSRGIVSPDIYDSARYLNKIRVEVGIAKMHPTTTQALEYLQTAEEVALYLNSLLNTPSQEYPQ
jgi:hypothetical protein